MPDSQPLPDIQAPWGRINPGKARDRNDPAPPPVVVPDHTLLRQVGQGAYGEVWLARNAIGQYRAVKVVRRQSFDDDRPFEREFAGMQRFEPVSRSHESQLNILHVGRGPDHFYYVMELADDQQTGPAIDEARYTPRTLRSDLQARGRLPVDECLRLGLALTTALGHLHRHGLVHRDIKPSNIVFVNGIPKLADIGLVAQAERTMSFVGTEGYLPPEGPGTVQADLFSLGKVLYEISTGHDRQEFPELPTDLADMPDRLALAEFNEVLVRACAPEIRRRYQTAEEMHADLALLQSGRSVARLRAVERRLALAARVAALVTAVAVLAGLAFLYQQAQTRQARSLADENARLADENRDRLIRIAVANGVQEMDHDESAQALVWLTDALSRSTHAPAQARLQRVRIGHLLARHPRLLQILPHPAGVAMAAFSPDDSRIVTAVADGTVRLWNPDDPTRLARSFPGDGPLREVRFTRDGRRLFVRHDSIGDRPGRVALLDTDLGRPVFPPVMGASQAVLSPDDRWLAVAGTKAVVRLLAADTGAVVAELRGHEEQVDALAFSPDSTTLATAGRDRTVRRWRVADGKPVGSPLLHSQPVSRVLFNGDATRLATVTRAGPTSSSVQFQTWETATGQALGLPIPGFEAGLVLGFDPPGRRLLTADGDRTARLWGVDSHAAATPSLALGGPARCHDFSPDGAWVAIGTENQTVRLWNVESGRPGSPPLHHPGRPESVRFSGDGSRLLIAGDDGTVSVWDLTVVPDDGQLRLKAFASGAAALAPDGRHLLVSVMDEPAYLQMVRLDPLDPLEVVPEMTRASHPGIPVWLSFDREGRRWATCPGLPRQLPFGAKAPANPGDALLGRWEGGQVRSLRLAHPTAPRGAFFHRDGRSLLTLGDDRTARLWNSDDGTLKETVPWPEADGVWLAVSPDLQTAIALFDDATGRHLRFRHLPSGRELGRPGEILPNVQALAFSPDGSRVAIAGDNQSGRIWNLATGEPLTPYFKHGGALSRVEWSPDGRRVLTVGNSPEVKIWEADTGRPALSPLVMRSGPAAGANFSQDGRYVVAWNDEKAVRVWDAATGEPVTEWLLHEDHVRAAFITHRQQLVTVSAQCVIRVWNLPPTELPAADLADYARLLSGQVTESSPARLPATPAELADFCQSLQARQPALFQFSPERLRHWHRVRSRDRGSLDQVRSAAFHLERLARWTPVDPAVERDLARLQALRVPPRDPALPARLLDLSRAYTHSLDLMQHGDFVQLPRGRQVLGGVEFDLRGLVELNHRAERTHEVGPYHPAAVVPVGHRCRALHFLQAAEGEPRIEGSPVARWIIHYQDGSTREWPVLYGRHLRDWWWWRELEPLDATEARTVWRGRALDWNLPGSEGVRLFESVWLNPQPEVPVARLEFRIGESPLKPFVVAVTAE